MNKIHSTVWSKVHNAMVVASELARSAGKGKNARVKTAARRKTLSAVIAAMALSGSVGLAQAADVTVDADGTTETLNATDTYIKITAHNAGKVDAAGNVVEILGNDASSDGSAVVLLKSGAQLVLDGGGTLENTHTTSDSHGLDAQDVGTKATLDGVTISTKGDGSHALRVWRDAALSVTDGEVLTEGVGGHGYQVGQGTLTITGGTVTAQGDSSLGVQVYGSGNVTLTGAVVIKTGGLEGHGILASSGSTVDISGGSLSTTNKNSHGVVASGEGQVTLSDEVAIKTDGESSFGLNARQFSVIEMSGGTVLTEGANAKGVYAAQDGTVQLNEGVEVTTSGSRAEAIYASDNSNITLNDAVLSTTGELASGVYAIGEATVVMSGGNIATQGKRASGIHAWTDSEVQLTNDVAISTQGENAAGISVVNNASVAMTGGSITTKGTNAHGVDAIQDSLVSVTGIDIETNGAQANGISTNYNAHATVVGGTITTTGHGADGIWATSDSQVDLKEGVVIMVKEESGRGIYAGSNAQVGMTGGSITTLKDYGVGLRLLSNGHITLSDGVAIQTQGDEAHGAHLTQDSILDMSGGRITTEGQDSHGIFATGDATVTLTDKVAITAQGGTSMGIHAADNASVTMSGGRVDIQGSLGSDGVSANDAATVVLTDDVAVTTANDFSSGMSSHDDSDVTMTGGSLSTSGILAAGVAAFDRSMLTLNDVAITTAGGGSYGAFVSDSAGLALTGVGIATAGDATAGVVAVQGGLVTLDDVSITTTGTNAAGLLVEDQASAHLSQVTMDTAGASIDQVLDASGPALPILVENSDLTRNNGVLLAVTGSNVTDATVLQLTNGTLAAGDITDVSTTNRSTLALASGAQWTGISRLDGNLTLTDAGTATHGGTAAIPIAIAGDVTVNNGAALGGNLDVGGMLSGNGGALRPGNSIGTQTFASAGGFSGDYHAEINAAGQSDLITVASGNFDLTGINLYVDEADGNGGYKLDHDYTIVTTGDATGISGVANNEFANGGELEGNLAKSLVKLDPVIYGADMVKIRLSIDAAKQLTLTDNQNAVVTAAEANPAVQKAVQVAGYADALDHLSGEIHASTQTALLDTGNLMQRTLLNRMRSSGGSPSCVDAVDLARDKVDHAQGCGPDYPLWAQVVGSWNHQDGDDNTASTRYRLGGLYLGGDKTFDNGWRVGGAVGFTDGKINANDRDSSADVKSYSAAVYGGKGWALSKGQLNLLMGAGYTYHDIDTDRNTNVLGRQNLSAGYHANSTQLFAELGYALPLSEAIHIEPYLNLAWTDLRTSGFSESGGSTAVQADSEHHQIFTQTVGLRGGTTFSAGKTDVSLLAGVGWRHADGDLDATRTMRFSQGGGDSFEIQGAPIAENAAVLDLGVEAKLGKNTALGLSYSGQFSDQGKDNTGSLYLRMKF